MTHNSLVDRRGNVKNIFEQVKKETVKVHLAGKIFVKGSIIELSEEILILYDGNDFMYISMEHIENVSVVQDEEEIQQPTTFPSTIKKEADSDYTLVQVLKQAKGMYTEVYVTNKHSLHGTITAVMDDYIVFYSPISKTIYIPFKHLKWIIPYSEHQRPYQLSDGELDGTAFNETYENLFALQVEKMKNKLVVFNLGEKSYFIGKLMNVHGKIIKLQTARRNATFINMQHIKTMHIM